MKSIIMENLIEDKTNRGKKDGEDGEEKKKRPVIKSATDLQRLKLEKLMKNPEKPIIIPEQPKEKDYMQTVPSFVRNVMGSSAGAGSGEFHVYRHLRRKEYARQKCIQAKSMREQLDEEYQSKLEKNRLAGEAKTAKKRAKRLKKKQRAKKPRTKQSDEKEGEEENDEETSEDDDGADAGDDSSTAVELCTEKDTVAEEVAESAPTAAQTETKVDELETQKVNSEMSTDRDTKAEEDTKTEEVTESAPLAVQTETKVDKSEAQDVNSEDGGTKSAEGEMVTDMDTKAEEDTQTEQDAKSGTEVENSSSKELPI